MSLAAKHCIPCKDGAQPVRGEERQRLLSELPGWSIVEDYQLRRTYEFPDFAKALEWVNQIGALAEAENHHPDLHLSWGRVRVDIYTHKINDLSENDFILAAKIDGLS